MASPACFLPQISTLSSATARSSYAPSLRSSHIVCQAQKQDDAAVSRRLALTVLIGAAAIGSKVSPADAAHGKSANIFGKPKTNTEYIPYSVDGFKLTIPSKWNLSKEREFPGQVLRYEDIFDATSNVSVIITSTDKKSIRLRSPRNLEWTFFWENNPTSVKLMQRVDLIREPWRLPTYRRHLPR